MFSVAIKGYGIVIYDDAGAWKVYSTSDSLSARLAMRVEFALQTVPADESDAREALLAIAGAGLLSASCDHAPGECDGESGN
jgi:hypothetical protein